ncbi:zinc-dependent alcohol dehydrogenase family protein [Streptomyces arboris]|uniref:zinc-dependent alcohol dehydrogenase family protein n=1 Tax=Streptomyces arboris TaxID=2600619 RepID=UPI00362B32E8
MLSRAVIMETLGGPEVLQVREVEVPPPAAGEVLVRVSHIGVNRPDLLFRVGLYPVMPTLPGSRLGVEASGVVEAVGPGVVDVAVGDQVVVGPVSQQSKHGVYGEHVVVPASEVVSAFEGVDARTSAASWMPYLTAYTGMVNSGGLKQGDHVVITAASSAAGLAAIDIARRLGAIPIAVTRSSDKAQRLQDAGAPHVIVGRDDLAGKVRALTGGRGADLVFDATGGPGFPATAEAAADDGRVVIYGWYDDRPATLPTRWPMRIIGHINFTTTQDPVRLGQARDFIASGVRSGIFAPRIDRVFHGLEEAAEAHRYADGGQQFGKILINLDRD